MSSIAPVADFEYRAKLDTGNATAQVIKPFEIEEAIVRCTAAHVGGTLTVQRSTDGTTYNNVTDALTCAADGTQARSGTVVSTQAVFAAGDYIRILQTNSAEGIVYVKTSPLRITGQ